MDDTLCLQNDPIGIFQVSKCHVPFCKIYYGSRRKYYQLSRNRLLHYIIYQYHSKFVIFFHCSWKRVIREYCALSYCSPAHSYWGIPKWSRRNSLLTRVNECKLYKEPLFLSLFSVEPVKIGQERNRSFPYVHGHSVQLANILEQYNFRPVFHSNITWRPLFCRHKDAILHHKKKGVYIAIHWRNKMAV